MRSRVQSLATASFLFLVVRLSADDGRVRDGAPVAPTLPTVTVSGFVQDDTGAPFGGAKATLTSASGQSRETTSDRTGRFQFAETEPGQYTLRVQAPDRPPVERPVDVVGASDDPLLIKVQLAGASSPGMVTRPLKATAAAMADNARAGEPARALGSADTPTPSASVSGVVLDPSGKPLPGAQVTLSGSGKARGLVSGANGRYTFDGVAPGEYVVRVEATAHKSVEVPVRVTSEAPRPLRIQMRASSAREASPRPVETVVAITPPPTVAPAAETAAASEAEEAVARLVAAEQAEARLTAADGAAKLAAADAAVKVAKAQAAEVAAKLAAESAATQKLAAESAAKRAEEEAAAHRSAAAVAAQEAIEEAAAKRAAADAAARKTAADTAARKAAAEAVARTAAATAAKKAVEEAEAKKTAAEEATKQAAADDTAKRAAAEAAMSAPDSAPAPTPAPFIISGSVEHPSGLPVSDAQVTLSGGSSETRESASDSDGRFEFGVEPGEYAVRVQAKTRQTIDVPIRVSADTPKPQKIETTAEATEDAGAGEAPSEPLRVKILLDAAPPAPVLPTPAPGSAAAEPAAAPAEEAAARLMAAEAAEKLAAAQVAVKSATLQQAETAAALAADEAVSKKVAAENAARVAAEEAATKAAATETASKAAAKAAARRKTAEAAAARKAAADAAARKAAEEAAAKAAAAVAAKKTADLAAAKKAAAEDALKKAADVVAARKTDVEGARPPSSTAVTAPASPTAQDALPTSTPVVGSSSDANTRAEAPVPAPSPEPAPPAAAVPLGGELPIADVLPTSMPEAGSAPGANADGKRTEQAPEARPAAAAAQSAGPPAADAQPSPAPAAAGTARDQHVNSDVNAPPHQVPEASKPVVASTAPVESYNLPAGNSPKATVPDLPTLPTPSPTPSVSQVLPPLPAGRFTVSGAIRDPSGDPLPGAQITIVTAAGDGAREAVSDNNGAFSFDGVGSGEYVVRVEAKARQPIELPVRITTKAPKPLKIDMMVGLAEEVSVTGVRPDEERTASAANADKYDFKDEDILSLPLPSRGAEIAGFVAKFLSPAAAGPEGVQIIVDDTPSSSISIPSVAIDHVRLNKDPYGAQYRRPGKARIEVETADGSRKRFHGNLGFSLRNSGLDSLTPLTATKPKLDRRYWEASFSGPLSRTLGSFFFGAERQTTDGEENINATTLEGPLNVNIPVRNTLTSAIGHLYFYIGLHKLKLLYQYNSDTTVGDGVGGFRLQEQAFDQGKTEHKFQLSLKNVFSVGFVNDFRAKVSKESSTRGLPPTGPAIEVNGAFIGGPNQSYRQADTMKIDVREVGTFVRGTHTVRFGGAFARRKVDEIESEDFGGVFKFASLDDFAAGVPYSFRINEGNPNLSLMLYEGEAFLQHEVTTSKRLRLMSGLRFDWQSSIKGTYNFSPRLGFAWATSEKQKTVVRGGMGMFYQQLPTSVSARELLYDGQRVRTLFITNPSYPDPFLSGGGQVVPTSILRLDPNLRTPYQFQTSLALEQHIGTKSQLSVEYAFLNGSDLFRVRDINAPLPLTLTRTRPDPTHGSILQVESTGGLKGHTVTVNFRGLLGKRMRATAQYTRSLTKNDVWGGQSGGFSYDTPADNYDLSGEWGRADFDRKQGVNATLVADLPMSWTLGAAVVSLSPEPYNITTGNDDNGDGYALDRPLGVIRNTGEGPSFFQLDLRLAKNWRTFHPLRRGEARSGTVQFVVDAFNVTKHTNYVSYIGVLTSPYFGRANQAKPSRTIQLALRYSF